MKRILLSLVTLVMALSVGALATRSAWTDTVSVTANVIQTGSLDLEVSNDGGTTWDSSTVSNPNASISGLIPGGTVGTGTYAFSLRFLNPSITAMDLSSFFDSITTEDLNGPTTPDPSKLTIEIWNRGTLGDTSDDVMEVGATLATWMANAVTIPPTQLDFTNQLLEGNVAQQHYEIRATLDSTAEDDWQGQTVTFDLNVIGTQVVGP